MAQENLIRSIENLKLFSTKNIASLKGHKNHKDFLQALIRIYEINIENYISGAMRSVKDLDKIINYAYAAFYKASVNNPFFSFVLFIKEKYPDLAISLGLADMKSVFVAVLARYLIFTHLASRELREVFLDPEAQAALVFPAYLFNAFLLQSQTADHPEYVFASLTGQLFYVSQFLIRADIPENLKSKSFAYLESAEKINEFIQMVASGYVQKSVDSVCKDQIEKYSQKILESEVRAVCEPSLVFMGIKAASSVEEVIKARLVELSAALKTVEDNKVLINHEADRLRGEAANQAEAIRNKPTSWVVGFGGINQPGPSFNF